MLITSTPVRTVLLLWLSGALVACAGPARRPPPELPRVVLPETRVYFYPVRKQTALQQDRDRFECNDWAVQQSGFDPSLPAPQTSYRVAQYSSPDNSASVTGAALGASLGALTSASAPESTDANAGRPGYFRANALVVVFGAMFGALVGSATDRARAEVAQQQADAEANLQRDRDQALLARAGNFRRAMTLCLSGRGYQVE